MSLRQIYLPKAGFKRFFCRDFFKNCTKFNRLSHHASCAWLANNNKASFLRSAIWDRYFLNLKLSLLFVLADRQVGSPHFYYLVHQRV